MPEYVGDLKKIISTAVSSTESRCMYFDRFGKRCKHRAIESHSLQKRGPIASIAEAGHVVKIGSTLKPQRLEDRQIFERIGVNKASVFFGFCNAHDSEVFAEIETIEIALSKRSAVLFAIRAIAMELYRKKVMVELQIATINHLGPSASPQSIKIPKLLLMGAGQAVEENMNKLKQLFNCFHKIPPPNFLYLAMEFDADLPFAVTGAFEPDWSLAGNLLYKVDLTKTKWNLIYLFCGCICGRYYFFASGFQKYHNHRIDDFLRSIEVSGENIASTLFTISACYSENCFIRESWKSSLSNTDHSMIGRMASSGVFDVIRDPQVLQLRIDMPKSAVVSLQSSMN